MERTEWDNIRAFERFANKAFDLRTNYIIQLHQLAYEHGFGWDLVKLYLETSRADAEELCEYSKNCDFTFGDPIDGTGASNVNKINNKGE